MKKTLLCFLLLISHCLAWGLTPSEIPTYLEKIIPADTVLSESTPGSADDLAELMNQLDEIYSYYTRRGVAMDTLAKIMKHADTLRDISEGDDATLITTAYHFLDGYRVNAWGRYEVKKERFDTARTTSHDLAKTYLPEDVIIPDAPESDTAFAILIDRSEQRLYVYDENVLVWTSSVTTGKKGYSTPTGNFSLKKKQTHKTLRSPFKNEHYVLHVDYWLEFAKSYGIHDACNHVSCWRKKFGGGDYKTRGSHGCVNAPYDTAKWIYENIITGSAVNIQE